MTNFWNRIFDIVAQKTAQPQKSRPALPWMNGTEQNNLGPRLVVLSGSGLSVGAGMPLYRAEDGLWNNFSISEVCDFHSWKDNKQKVQEFYQSLYDLRLGLLPSKGHKTLDLISDAHYTQNVDELCLRSTPLHGSLFDLQCLFCGALWRHSGRIDLDAPCPQCQKSGDVKPSVVFFHEAPPAYAWLHAELSVLRQEDVLLVVGTSGEVIPIVSLCKQMRVPSQKWLFNRDRSFKLPEDFFDDVVFGDFDQTCETLHSKWEAHKIHWKTRT